jgi:hypothetical protein
MHVIVIDEDGLFTGTRGTVLETYPFVSVASNAKADDGTTNYIVDVINNRSTYIKMVGFGSSQFSPTAGTAAANGTDYP